ncbi:hypothetical protein TBLA_0B07810 [Henningerozyma blattae CBS 6284]|uniref:Uncharacterized protein n=1 Tax=Henningerozyma blattae (strain ATCC 34711 / CBS 6284 / DSM 70876 / NBRC 10599 / NRRL Y-10934 / UCD 77-7) TaxID=1071380 RepID=I2GZP5_HENB6|nr:hypothetical protein TBLA_0B07810 [Tetrapisispora blattae CBS 6284]CCH59597.1 hypothetical protein TBLA_0B07810 [Tetrapisispora blattae CBS 6284]
MAFLVSQIRAIFRNEEDKERQVALSRKAFFQLIGYLGGCVIISYFSHLKQIQDQSFY